jgi:hypothetical protein
MVTRLRRHLQPAIAYSKIVATGQSHRRMIDPKTDPYPRLPYDLHMYGVPA